MLRPRRPRFEWDNLRPINTLLKKDCCWHRYCVEQGGDIRATVVENVTKVLACGYSVMGCKEYVCSNQDCRNPKLINFTCKSKFCPRCGAKATDQWMQTQNAILPNCDYQHAVFTLPAEIGQLFRAKNNRWLLNKLSKCSANVLLKLAKKRGVTVGIFTAIHTFGRRLNWHVHMHLSVTAGGLDENGEWVEITFQLEELMQPWKDEIAALLRKYCSQLEIPESLLGLFGNGDALEAYLTHQCKKSTYWHVYIAKQTKGCRKTAGYIGRYVRRPPISESRLRHYNADGNIIFNYHDHRTGKRIREVVTPDEMMQRLALHIHEKHFKGIRFYGFLANRVRKDMLPQVYTALGEEPTEPFKVTYASMAKAYLRIDPYCCALCGSPLVFNDLHVRMPLKELLNNWEAFALDRQV